MDIRQRNHVYISYMEKKRKERLQNILDIADACKMAFASVNVKNGQNIYNRWHRSIERQIHPEEKNKNTIWDRIKKNRRSLVN